MNPKNCKHEKEPEQFELQGHKYERCPDCGCVKRVDIHWPADWSKVGDEDN